jgi:hypothetical protein
LGASARWRNERKDETMGDRGGGIYISGGAIALVILIILLIWLL